MSKRKIAMLCMLSLLLTTFTPTTVKAGEGYDRIEQTESTEVIEITEEIGARYAICPELLQAMIFYESSNKMSAKNGGCVGYMQVSTKYHGSRAASLGVSLYDGYGNILTGTDYLAELLEDCGDVATALMVYHGERNAKKKGEAGEISDYAEKILELSEKLERKHGK